MSYTYHSPEDEIRTLLNGIIVRRTRILCTQFVVHSAWEPRPNWGTHHTITTFDGQWYGTLHSRNDDSSFRDLPGGSPARIAAVRAHYAANDAAAYDAILTAFPEAATGKRSDGEIEVYYP